MTRLISLKAMDVVVLTAISGNGQCTRNEGDAKVIRKRTLENRLVVPAIYSLRTRNKRERVPSNKGKSKIYEHFHRKNCKKPVLM